MYLCRKGEVLTLLLGQKFLYTTLLCVELCTSFDLNITGHKIIRRTRKDQNARENYVGLKPNIQKNIIRLFVDDAVFI